jgi:phosphoribosylamine---glycine ligase
MNVLLLGSGGREHSLAWKIAQSKLCTNLFIGPGNAGTKDLGENLAINPEDFEQVKAACLKNKIDLVVVGPEAPLVNGIVNYIEQDSQLKHIAIIGPDKYASQLEGSKAFAKSFMKEYGIPTAEYVSVCANNLEEGLQFLDKQKAPFVLKADGLAAGKGVLILNDKEEAKATLRNMLDGQFGDASKTVVIEQFLDGIELSVFVLTDGENYILLPEAKDYKRIGEQDTGLNTGGMGSISPVPFADKNFLEAIEKDIIQPTILGIQRRKMNYKGFIFFGLIKVDNKPFVIEYNVRMGDPETESVIPRIQSDLLEILHACYNKNLKEISIETDPRTAATVMLVSGGYPENYEKNKPISGLETINDSLIFHAGTKHENGQILSSGGRVLAICTLSHDIPTALKISYSNAEKIHFDKKYYRKDIGFDL